MRIKTIAELKYVQEQLREMEKLVGPALFAVGRKIAKLEGGNMRKTSDEYWYRLPDDPKTGL